MTVNKNIDLRKIIQEEIREYILQQGEVIYKDGVPLRLKQDALTEIEGDDIKNINKIPGGEGDETLPADVDKDEYIVGVAVEMEHTDNEAIAREIALDHLTENPKYYTILMKSGLVDEPEAIQLYNKFLKGKYDNE